MTSTTWGQLGLTGEWAAKPISLYGRNSASGTYGFFKEHTLKNGDFKDSVKEQPGSASVVQGVTVDRFAMGYSGIGYATAGVRAVPLTEKDGGKCIEATADNAYSGAYPLARFLYVYVNKAPGKPLDPLMREFVKLMVSKEGQEAVVKDGYFPHPGPGRQGRADQGPVGGHQRRRAARPPARPSLGPGRRVGSSSIAWPPAWWCSAASSSSPPSWPSCS